MAFQKGYTPWNKDKKIVDDSRIAKLGHNRGKVSLARQGIYKNCMKCKKQFYVKRYLINTKMYCSLTCCNANKKGRPAWNRGKKWSPAMKAKMSASRLKLIESGYKVTTKPRFGSENSAWKGGVVAENKKDRVRFLKILQPQILHRDNYTCQICNQYGGRLQVDHIQKWCDYPELRFVESNCRTLCMACHYYVTFKRKLPEGSTWGHNLKWRMK